MLLSTITLIAVATLSMQEKAEIGVKHVSAQYIYDQIMFQGRFDTGRSQEEKESNALLPKGVKISVTEGSNSLTAVGSGSAIREMELIIALFDKAPRQVELEIKAFAPVLNRTVQTTTTIYNNNAWEYFDESSETKIKVIPRINGDDTITMFITCGTLGSYATVVVRFTQEQTVYIHISPRMVKNAETGEMESRLELAFMQVEHRIEGFFTDESPFPPGSGWSINQTNWLGDREETNPLNPPKEAEFRIEITAKLPANSETK